MKLKLIIISLFIFTSCLFQLNIYADNNISQLEITDMKIENISYYSAELIWNTTDEAESTLLYWESQNFSPDMIGTKKGREHKVSLNRLRPDTKYYYQIYPDKADIELDVNSEIYSFTTAEYKISDVKVQNIGYTSADISWNTTYEDKSTILYWSSKGDMVDKIVTGESKAHTVSLHYLMPDTKYYYQIYSDNLDLYTNISSEVFSFNTRESIKITNITENNIGDNTAEISWNTTDKAKSTILYWSSQGEIINSIQTIESKEHTVSLPYILPGKKYYYKIYTEKPDLYIHVESDTYSFTTPGTDTYPFMNIDDKVTNIKAENIGYRSAGIRWTLLDEADLTLRYGTSPDQMYESIEIADGNDNKALLSDLVANTEYYYQISIYDPTLQATATSDIYSFKTEDYKLIDLSVKDIDSVSAKISWTTTDEANSIIRYGISPDQMNAEIEITGGKEHTVTIRDLIPKTKYYYQIYTRNPESNIFVVSDLYSFTTAGWYKITDIAVKNIGYTSTEISWTTTDGADSILACGRSPMQLGDCIYTSEGKEHKATINKLQPGKKYYFAIQAEKTYLSNSHKYIVRSELYSFTTVQDSYKISGYISPDFINIKSNTSNIKSGFKVELEGIGLNAVSDENGYFEIIDIPSGCDYTLKISKPNYLHREIKNVAIENDLQISNLDGPIDIWAGDIAKEGVQDNVINIMDIIEMAKVFNSSIGDISYKLEYDFNSDDVINMLDIVIVAKHFNCSSSDY
ncbi:MAG TPA: fibronectin type III domain-containing protein [Pseudobacteroides sp.]|uniref:fibronectin type III domain-containing protein n=1 Tax=Pseudobacteroides sp. TaxID=1968840 RepID=UPI002F92F90D